ncbi:DNA-binding protein [Christiangramia fulva]|uniref:DNA-binding protein n=1 Tax=Christiangramia fulva TaxID=2126553 RepID=A0A2R3Z915_9FLAO|nr:helix-turn-helix domain-containing protein [Christiangramia fulva]AVR46767.1 DNA-binding protein [Christiangramia fulva]
MATNIRVEKICEHCGKTFIAKTMVTRYCSHTCNSRAYKEKKKYEKLNGDSVSNNEEIIKKVPGPSSSYLSIIKETEFLTVPEVAKLLRLSKATVYRLIKEGNLKAVKFSQRSTRVKRSEIDNLFKN